MRGDEMIPVPAWRLQELREDLRVLEDWLLHASEDTLIELAEFACPKPYGRPVAELIDEIGWHGVALHDLLSGHPEQR